MAESTIKALGDTGWVRLKANTDGIETNGIFCRRTGNVVCLALSNYVVTFESGTAVCTLPDWAKPSVSMNTIFQKSGNIYASWISKQGVFNITAGAANLQMGGTITYIAGD